LFKGLNKTETTKIADSVFSRALVSNLKL